MKHAIPQDDLLSRLLVSPAQEMEDISGRRRKIKGVLAPQTVDDVQWIVQWAGRTPGTKLHPVSCGNNWGFGSSLPSRDGAYILNLSQLNRIRQLDLESGFVEIEPGVTQGTLDARLEKTGRTHFFNVTGAGSATSILGNALEKGIGYFGFRHLDVLDLEVVLPNGEMIHTSSCAATPYHAGLGPNLKELFLQSSLGIVTAARIRLPKRPECMGAILIKLLPNAEITKVAHVQSVLQAEGLIGSVPHLANKARTYITFAPHLPPDQRPQLQSSLSTWSAVVPVFGTVDTVKHLAEEVGRRLAGLATCDLILPASAPGGWMQSLLDLSHGIPTDIALPGVGFAALGQTENVGTRLEEGLGGLIHVVPACRPVELRKLLGLIRATAKKWQPDELPQTINVVNPGTAIVVISVPFRRNDIQGKAQALSLARDLTRQCADRGFVPYRLGLEDADLMPAESCARSRLVEAIRKTFDPKEILCPSKYLRQFTPPSPEAWLEPYGFGDTNGSSAHMVVV